MATFIQLTKLDANDQVAIISPSSGLPELFPWVQDLGLQRLKDVFHLKPIEYPTTRSMNSSLVDRARDVMDAFSDGKNKAVITSIGGSDQIELIKLLDPNVFIHNPKPFFGYSDNTHLHNFLWNLGIPSYYGGSVMTQLAMQTEMDTMTRESIRQALFTTGDVTIKPSDSFNDVGLSWADESNLTLRRQYEHNDGWFWEGTKNAHGRLWGGCVESLVVQLAASKYLPSDEDLEGCILFLETAEDIPEHWIIQYVLTGMGERGWLNSFSGILIGRPKAWEYDKPYEPEVKAKYRADQRDTVIQTVRKYNNDIPIVQNLDFGHTDPQTILPYGGMAILDSSLRTITLSY